MASVGPSPSNPAGGESETPPGVRMIIGGYDVRFPFKPYASQIGIASRVLKALDTGTNALLESPTGSGKSLALLCAAMAWQERWKATREAADAHGDARDVERHDRCAEAEPTDRASKPSGGGKKEKVPRVYYATRTHSQIAQVVRELKRTAYRPTMTVLGSREHYCVNQKARNAAMKGGNLGEECKSLLEAAGRRKRGGFEEDEDETENDAPARSGGCGYSHGALKLAGKASRPGAEPLDIEDLVTLGKKTRGCPYFAAKHAHETAELVFCPYAYLLDPSVRAAMDVDVAGALVILDEAHNVEDTAREAASCDVHLHDLRAAAEEFERVAAAEAADAASPRGPDVSAADGAAATSPDVSGHRARDSGHALLARVAGSVARWLHGASDQDNPRCPLRPHGFERWMAVWSGGANVQRQLRDAGLAVETLASVERARSAAVKAANDSSTPGALRVSGHALKTVEVLLTSARYALAGGGGNVGRSADDFRLAVQKRFDEPVPRKRGSVSSDETLLRDGGVSFDAAKVTLSLWALNPALAFADIAGARDERGTNALARSVVLTSGTLAPLDSFASELGAPFPIRMEAPHCVDVQTQVWCGAVAAGASGTRLSGTFKTSVEFSYQDDLGGSLEKWCLEIPHGVLVFFPSYSLLDRVAQRWKSTGAWRRLEQATGKKLFQEPRGGGGGGGGGRGKGRGSRGGRGGGGEKNALESLLSKYYRAVRMSAAAAPHAHAAAPVGSPCRGAVLLAVCRGKVSEGIDFADANARGVVVVGIPYPNLKDKQVELKRKYNDEKNAKNRAGVLSGDQWYSQQAFRALNQAVGRCLRHRNDHGAVLLVDERYAHGANDALVRNLPKWLRPATRKCADFDASVAGLRAFFSLKAKHAPPEAARAPPPAKLLPSVGAEKDAKERDGGGGKGGGKPKDSKEAAADARQRDIKRFFQPAAAATDALETRAEVTALSAPAAPAAPPVEQSVRKSPAPVAAPPTRWRSAPVPAVFAPPRPAPDPLVTSQLTDPPSATRTREVTETAPVASPSPGIAKSSRDGCADGHLDENPGFASARGLELAMELTEDIFVWGDDAETVGTSPKKNSHRLRSAATPEDPPTNADPDELSVWGETPGTQGFGARGWGATQQFRNFAPAPDPVPETKPAHRAEPETEPSPAPARVSLPTNAKRRAAETVATTDASARPTTDNGGSSSSSEHLPLGTSLLRPRGLGFGRVAVCRACGAKSVSTATALALPDAAEASATPARRVALGTHPDGTRDGPAYLAALARANAGLSPPVCHRARLFQPGEPFPLRCASAVRVQQFGQNSPRNGPQNARGDADAPAMPAMPLSPEARGRADLGAWSRADGCYFVPLRCGARWVGARVEATDGAASALVETAAVESDFSASPSGAPRTSKRRAALKPGAAFLLEDALASSAAGREDEDALACLRLARRGEDRAERDERGVEDASREPIENAIEVFEEEDDREDADRENAPDPEEGGKPKRRRVRRKASAEAARAALLRERNNGDDAFGS